MVEKCLIRIIINIQTFLDIEGKFIQAIEISLKSKMSKVLNVIFRRIIGYVLMYKFKYFILIIIYLNQIIDSKF